MKRGHEKMKRGAMDDVRFAAARTNRTRQKEALDSRLTPVLTDPMLDSSEAPVDRHRKKTGRENPMLHHYLNREDGDGKDKEKKLIREEEEDHELEEEDEQDEEDEYSVGSDTAHYLMARHDDDQETHRLAVVNMDWDHIRAVDLYIVLTSCVPKGGRVLSVSVYPSEYGLKCMNAETTQGPSALIGADADGGEGDNNNDGEEDRDLDSETRGDGLNRLMYYYAVVVCDSIKTADHLYMTLDGVDFLKAENVFDLQFIPDSREFKYPARDVATEAPLSYKGPVFATRALQPSEVKLPYDEDDIASDDDELDNSGDESLPNGVAKRELTNKEKLALLLQGDKSDEGRTDDQVVRIPFNQHSVAKIDLSKDEGFSPMLTSPHLYALDPTDPWYKRSVRKQAGKKKKKGAHWIVNHLWRNQMMRLLRRRPIRNAPTVSRGTLRLTAFKKASKRVKVGFALSEDPRTNL